MPLIRPEIPNLDPSQTSSQTPFVLARSFPFGREAPLRMLLGDTLTISLQTDPERGERALVELLTTLDAQPEGSLRECTFSNKGAGLFTLELKPEHCGMFLFRARYSLDAGKSWSYDSVPYSRLMVDPAAVAGLRLYTLIPSVSGHFGMWKKELTRIRDMGFNAVHLLPITHLDESLSPYSAHDFFSVDPSYLDPHDSRDGLTQFESFVEEAKNLGLRLCFDLVLNHVGVKSRIAQISPTWIVSDAHRHDGFKRAGCWHGHDWVTWEDLVLLNYDHPDSSIREALWTYMMHYALFWGYYADYTGGLVRFDNLHSSDPEFLETLTRVLRASYPDLILFAEYFSDQDTLIARAPEWHLNLLLATPWECKFVPVLRDYLRYLHAISPHLRYLTPITSHDSGTPNEEFGKVTSTVPRYVAAALLGCGATGMVQGVEWGIASRINFIGRQETLVKPGPVDWSDLIRAVNQLLEREQAFQIPGNCEFIDDGHAAIIAALRRDPEHPGRAFLVACNFDIGHSQRLKVDLQALLKTESPVFALNLLHRSRRTNWGVQKEFSLRACEAQVWELSSIPSSP